MKASVRMKNFLNDLDDLVYGQNCYCDEDGENLEFTITPEECYNIITNVNSGEYKLLTEKRIKYFINLCFNHYQAFSAFQREANA